MPLDKMIKKAYRLIKDGRIERVGDGTYNIIGDHGTYIVATGFDGTVSCSCPGFTKKRRCSHSLAVILLMHGLVRMPYERKTEWDF
ncbi:TPA: hypothetical protein EYP70_06680 [Candidatus Bathyarchaeota archaeon]|nr:hypothetical protein [Candidatus Bathyarchaeota archaeon]